MFYQKGRVTLSSTPGCQVIRIEPVEVRLVYSIEKISKWRYKLHLPFSWKPYWGTYTGGLGHKIYRFNCGPLIITIVGK
jgi:hypothetical protein